MSPVGWNNTRIAISPFVVDYYSVGIIYNTKASWGLSPCCISEAHPAFPIISTVTFHNLVHIAFSFCYQAIIHEKEIKNIA